MVITWELEFEKDFKGINIRNCAELFYCQT